MPVSLRSLGLSRLASAYAYCCYIPFDYIKLSQATKGEMLVGRAQHRAPRRLPWLREAIINPRCACAARVTVLGLCVCLSVCLCVCVSVSTYSSTTGTKPAHERHQRL